MLTSFGNANAFYKKINNSVPILAKTPKENFQRKKNIVARAIKSLANDSAGKNKISEAITMCH